jgi:hypothetical protein
MWEAVAKEHGDLSMRDALVTLTAMEWADRTMIEKATQWLFENVYDYLNPEDQERVESFRKYLEE